MMSYEEFTQKEAALESAPRAEREAFYAEILEKETTKTDVRMMAYFHAALLHYREGDFRAAREILEPFVIDYQSYAYRPEIIACFNLMGVAVYCERSYALARFYIHEGLKIARENHNSCLKVMSWRVLRLYPNSPLNEPLLSCSRQGNMLS